MWLICPTLYWARHSSQVATRKEEKKKCLWCPFPGGRRGMVPFRAAATEAAARLCLMHQRSSVDVPPQHLQPNPTAALSFWPCLNFQGLCCALLYLDTRAVVQPCKTRRSPAPAEAWGAGLRNSSLEMSDSCWDPPGAIHCRGWAEIKSGAPDSPTALRGSPSGIWGDALTAQPEVGGWMWFCQWDNQGKTFGNSPPRYL